MLNGFLHGGSSFMAPVVFVFSAMCVASTMVLHHFLYGTFINLKKLFLNYCSRKSYYKYMVIFAT